jgi:hypothetical protein
MESFHVEPPGCVELRAVHQLEVLHPLPELSNFACLPGKAGGLPILVNLFRHIPDHTRKLAGQDSQLLCRSSQQRFRGGPQQQGQDNQAALLRHPARQNPIPAFVP